MLNKYSTETLEAAAITSNLGNSARRENDTQFEFSGGLFKNLLVSKNDDKVSKANRRIFDVESKSCLKNNLLW
ncbi:uncharacterized protein OCT59_010145 [Rhizophagus irregularis]|uniref:uncharacterized protein n=1 Tax=Rhizophagus irregularis TaxID=588596 RepID=UPI001C1A9F80|nr:hypothetical protein OCT59_010145 [Rhizophagus irregularis]CAB5163887.1 unnamed protein product [Rhizophagus irregularis]